MAAVFRIAVIIHCQLSARWLAPKNNGPAFLFVPRGSLLFLWKDSVPRMTEINSNALTLSSSRSPEKPRRLLSFKKMSTRSWICFDPFDKAALEQAWARVRAKLCKDTGPLGLLLMSALEFTVFPKTRHLKFQHTNHSLKASYNYFN